MRVCRRDGEAKKDQMDRVMTMREPAGRLGEIVRTLKRNHQSGLQAIRPQEDDQAATSSPCCASTLAVSNRP
jgi:hypothetical protein